MARVAFDRHLDCASRANLSIFMFKGHAQVDFSGDLREPEYWDVGTLDALRFCSDATALAFDPISRLLAVGTSEKDT